MKVKRQTPALGRQYNVFESSSFLAPTVTTDLSSDAIAGIAGGGGGVLVVVSAVIVVTCVVAVVCRRNKNGNNTSIM